MKRTGALWFAVSLLFGCSTEKPALIQPNPLSAKPEPLFSEPTEIQSNRLADLDTLLRGSVANLNLSWVSDMGVVAIPICLREAGDETLPVEGRDLILIVLGNALKKAGFREHPDARNNLVVPVLLQALDYRDPHVQRSAAFAARFVDDTRLVPGCCSLLLVAPGLCAGTGCAGTGDERT